jgi:crotonobetainyl-CoA:carnitine CoA-transferase CaiB-like acyl-CoA transferase
MVRLSDATWRPGRPAPEIGQHTREILSEFGYPPDEVADLYGSGIVR